MALGRPKDHTMPDPTRGSTQSLHSKPTLSSAPPGRPPLQVKYIRGGGGFVRYWQLTRQGYCGGHYRIGTATLKRVHHHPCERAYTPSQQRGEKFTSDDPRRGGPSHCWSSQQQFHMDHPLRRISRQRCGISFKLYQVDHRGYEQNI